jgi:hypothetical protein
MWLDSAKHVIGDRWSVTEGEITRRYPCDDRRRSPRYLRPLPEPTPGECFTTALGGRRFGKIVEVVPGEHLTGCIMGAVISYVLVWEDLTTRLLLKIVMAQGRLTAPLLAVGDLVMARRQLLNLARLAEQTSPI